MVKVPDHWYQYEFPLPEVPGAPVPSQANYSPQNVAWMIEMFMLVLGLDPETSDDRARILFRYENNTPSIKSDDIFVGHHDPNTYLPDKQKCYPDTPELIAYEKAAKKSSILKLFQDESPAGIEYFKDTGCGEILEAFALPPSNILHSEGFSGYHDGIVGALSADMVREQPVWAHNEKVYLANTAQPNQKVVLQFDDLPTSAPEMYSSVTLKWFDKSTSTGNSAGVTLQIGESGDLERHYYTISQGYTYHQFVWIRGFAREEINDMRMIYHDGANPTLLPTKQLTAVELVAQSV
jgi:hypothetical protein